MNSLITQSDGPKFFPQPKQYISKDNAYLLDICKACRKIIQFSQGYSRLALAENEEKQSAILYQIIVIAEAVKRLSPQFRQQHPSIPWRNIAGMRDILSHQYDRINFDTLWDVVDKDIPELLLLLEPIVPTNE